MSKFTALAATIGVLALVCTWLFGLPPLSKLFVWQAFIAWGCHFQSGGKVAGCRSSAVCMSFGAVIGMAAALLIAPLAPLGPLAAPVAVGVGAAVIVIASKVPWLETVPAGFYGFAVIFAVIGLGKVEPVAALLPTVLSILIGALFGYVSEWIAGALARKDVAAAAAAA
jgi:hypothetical protein